MSRYLAYWTKRGIAIYAWDALMGPMWRYVVIADPELAAMQGVAPGRCHPICVVDDFGNLVRVEK